MTDPGPMLDGVRITRGRFGDSPTTQPTTIEGALRDEDGDFSPRNPQGQYYGQLRKGTPMQIAVDLGSGDQVLARAAQQAWNPRWDGTNEDGSTINPRVPIDALGILARLSRDTEQRSALRRTLTAANGVTPVAYYPLEDGESSTLLENAAGPGSALVTGGVFADPTGGPVGSSGAVKISVGTPGADTFELPVPPYTDTGTTIITVHVRQSLQDQPSGTNFCSGQISIPLTGTAQVAVFSWAGGESSANNPIIAVGVGFTAVANVNDIDIVDNADWTELQVRMVQNGPDIDFDFFVNGVLIGSDTEAGATVGLAYKLWGFTGQAEDGSGVSTGGPVVLEVCHVSVHTDGAVGQFADAMNGYPREAAAARVERTAAEEGITIVVTPSDSTLMGPQRPATTLGIWREAEAADHGTLFELRDGRPCFQPLRARWNAPVALALSYTDLDVTDLVPFDDDRDLYNVITVTRTGGSSVTVSEPNGPNGTDETTGIGPRPLPVTLNLASDDALLDHAGWLLMYADTIPLGPGITLVRISPREMVAKHEAGHAVVAVALGVEIRDAVIGDDEERGRGYTATREVPDPWVNLLIAVAGEAAFSRSLSEPDMEQVRRFGTVQEMPRAIAAARDILWPRAAAVRAVAEALYRDGRLTGERIVEIVRASEISRAEPTST